jgi:hypothetical protein
MFRTYFYGTYLSNFFKKQHFNSPNGMLNDPMLRFHVFTIEDHGLQSLQLVSGGIRVPLLLADNINFFELLVWSADVSILRGGRPLLSNFLQDVLLLELLEPVYFSTSLH